MRNYSSKTRRFASALAAASLAAAVPVAAAGTAEANPASSRVKVGGTASCERFEDTTVTQVSITPKGRSAKTADLSGEDVTETYSVTFTNIPKGKGLTANATVNCEDSDGQAHTYSKSFSITRPAGTTENQTLNLK